MVHGAVAVGLTSYDCGAAGKIGNMPLLGRASAAGCGWWQPAAVAKVQLVHTQYLVLHFLVAQLALGAAEDGACAYFWREQKMGAG